MNLLGKKVKNRYMSRNPKFDYLPDQDRYFSYREQPSYKFNIIGCGNIGREHMKVTMMEERATIYGVYDQNPSSIEEAERLFSTLSDHSLVKYDSLQAACHDPEADGLIICTPNYTHIDVIREAVKSGKHILLEKPMATTLRDAYEIMQLAKDYESVFQIGLQYRYKAIYAESIHETLERKAIGDVKTISMTEHRIPFLDKVNQWNKFSKYSGGTLVEKCCHYFDLMNLFAQSKPVQVYASGNMAVNFTDFTYNNEQADIIDNAFVTVIYENDVRANFNLCMFSPTFYEELVICGDKGRLKASENEDFLSAKRPRNHLEILCGEEKPSRLMTPAYPDHIETSGHGGATYYEHVYFIDNIENKQTTTATVEDGLWSVLVGLAAEQSIKLGKAVMIEEILKESQVTI
ncbi:Gfo/Idh/MocA family protein [Metabacillus sediminilitoris]|uniref:Gfo/Idh/MocA family oxidoreductase n=1 Tax=Metabacillus sediminilitoris TaxID=2567941 RepID=A0A4S4BRB7_9BACI|nr:Gfo/Idh/MocA family oxidoreductase [Metabacillus sediminilitoris]QGQ48312.1 gfo/Idh/MocA family oxidoreductase [Metabacillus sediminilitoris]THF76968.1 Gfo/Idh/MocA family oxidoreductase [Metabacillus sediminilitoris]